MTGESSAATISAFTVPRLAAVVGGIDPGGVTRLLDWRGGGAWRQVAVQDSMYEMVDGTALLAAWATNGRFARAVAAQLDFEFEADGAPFCGRRGRMRLAVLDGAVGPEEVRMLVTALADDERVTVVAKIVLPGAEEMLASLSKGSRIRKAPRDVLAHGNQRARRRDRNPR